MATKALSSRQDVRGPAGDGASPQPGGRPLAATGAIAACAAAATGLAVLTLLTLAGWIAAPHGGQGLTGVLRAAAVLWLIAHHVGFALRGTGRIGMLPLGLVLLPGALLWRAGRWVVRSARLTRLRQVGYAALALAVPYAALAAALARASRSARVAPSLPQAALAGLLLALTAGGLGGARALAPWRKLATLLPARLRSVLVGATVALAVLVGVGALLAAASLSAHLHQFGSVSGGLDPGTVGAGLLLLAQLSYLPNALIWAVSFMLGPGFAFGAGTVVAPTGSALGPLPRFPLLAALPSGPHAAFPPALAAAALAVPYLAGVVGGLTLARVAPTPVLEAAPMWGFGAGALAGGTLGVLAAFSGGPLGAGRLAVVGPSGWQIGLVAALEMGVAAAISGGAANWLRCRGVPRAGQRPAPLRRRPINDAHHTIYVDPWAGDAEDPQPGDAEDPEPGDAEDPEPGDAEDGESPLPG
jgi:Family of unknown function (DUF6350)